MNNFYKYIFAKKNFNMAVLNIVKMGHPILRKKAIKVSLKEFESILGLVKDMKDTLEYIGASGLAAPQVLVNKRVVVYRVNRNRMPKDANFKKSTLDCDMINPIIKPLNTKKKRILGKVSFCTWIAWEGYKIFKYISAIFRFK